MLKYYVVFLMLALSVNLAAQDIEDEILRYEDKKTTAIKKGRGLLLEKFEQGDFEKVKEIKDYLMNEIQDSDYLALYPTEYWIILYSTLEYDELMKSMANFSIYDGKFSGKIVPSEDLVSERLMHLSAKSGNLQFSNIELSDLSQLEKDFLKLAYNKLILNEVPGLTQDYVNEEADKFLVRYPDNRFVSFTRQYIRYKFKSSNWGWTCEFFTGYSAFTGSLDRNFGNNVPFGVAFDVLYKDFSLYLRDYIGFTKLRRDIPYSNGIWERKSNVQVYLPEATIGYALIDNNKYKISPFAGISSTAIVPPTKKTEENPLLENAQLDFSTTWSFGINADLKYGVNKYRAYHPSQDYWFIRIRYAYNLPQFKVNYPEMTGCMHYLTIGIGGQLRRMKRDF